jgi:cyclic patellamide precursor peptide PatG
MEGSGRPPTAAQDFPLSSESSEADGSTDLPMASNGAGSSLPMSAPASSSYVYALGRIEPRFPTLALEKEFAQAISRPEAAGLTEHQATLSERHDRYLAGQLCWLLTIEGLETYILKSRDSADLDLLIDQRGSRRPPQNADAR